MPTDLARLLARKEKASRDRQAGAVLTAACFMISLLAIALMFAHHSIANAFELLVIG
jgi:hypothetical protein